MVVVCRIKHELVLPRGLRRITKAIGRPAFNYHFRTIDTVDVSPRRGNSVHRNRIFQYGRKRTTLGGDKIKAKAAYQEFLTLWKDADSDIPLYRQAKDEYAKLL